ncbi:MAG: MBL fold metallo-hydrolase [Eubacteriales bacterium]|nr:MBL fold metallo-hydrolase [Eubacteriales bacterium]
MKITWIGHSCFKIEKDGRCIVVDPYADGSVPGLDPVAVTADQVLCSHEHGDHNGRAEVALTGNTAEDVFSVETIQTFHDEVQGAKRGRSQIFVIRAGNEKAAHFGDLGCELTAEQMEQLQDLDAALIPVGGYYTIDGKQAAKLMKNLKPRIVIPMHYRDDQAGFGYREISTVENFLEEMDSVRKIESSEVTTEEAQETQVIVMQPLRRKNR